MCHDTAQCFHTATFQSFPIMRLLGGHLWIIASNNTHRGYVRLDILRLLVAECLSRVARAKMYCWISSGRAAVLEDIDGDGSDEEAPLAIDVNT
jgi:hypothetical protein